MADALMDMKSVPEDGRLLIRMACGAFGVLDARHTYQSDQGYLPLPSDASSANVAPAAGEWLSVCQDEHVEAVTADQMKRLPDDAVERLIREALCRKGVVSLLIESAKHFSDFDRDFQDLMYEVINSIAQEPTDG